MAGAGFALTFDTGGRRSRRSPWELSQDGGRTWWTIGEAEGRRMVEAYRLPLDRLDTVAAGGVVRLDDAGAVLIRRRRSAVEVEVEKRQAALF